MSHEVSDSGMNEFVHTVGDALAALVGWRVDSIDRNALNQRLDAFLSQHYGGIHVVEDEEDTDDEPAIEEKDLVQKIAQTIVDYFADSPMKMHLDLHYAEELAEEIIGIPDGSDEGVRPNTAIVERDSRVLRLLEDCHAYLGMTQVREGDSHWDAIVKRIEAEVRIAEGGLGGHTFHWA